MSEPSDVIQTMTGRGILAAEGCEAVRVRYRIVVERRREGVVAHGTLRGSHTNLRPIWLEPDSVLRLKDGQRLDVALTDLVGDVAEFESTGQIPSSLL